MRWRRICVDVAADGQVLSGSIEEYPSIGGTGGFTALRVIAPSFAWVEPVGHFHALLAESWDEPELPFPPKGWIEDSGAPTLERARRQRPATKGAVTSLSGDGPEDEDVEF